MAAIEIIDIKQHKLDPDLFLGGRIDRPPKGTLLPTYDINITGWVLPRDNRPINVAIAYKQREITWRQGEVAREDIAKLFPDAQNAGMSGFNIRMNLFGFESNVRLEVYGVMPDFNPMLLGSLKLRINPPPITYKPRIKPLMVTFFGRSGSTLMMKLLSQHPEIVVHPGYPYETGVQRYWMHMLRVMGETGPTPEIASTSNFTQNPHRVGPNPFHGPGIAKSPELRAWLGGDYLSQMVDLSVRMTDGFYLADAKSLHKKKAAFFAEKRPFNAREIALHRLTWQLYPNAREIVLIRDFRDILCSVYSFNAKRGYLDFGYDKVSSDLEYVKQLRQAAKALYQNWRENKERAMLLRYEDLVTDQHGSLKRIFAYLGLNATDATVAKVLEQANVDGDELAAHRTTSDSASSIGRWKRDLPEDVREPYTEILSDVLKDFGYTV